MKKLDKKIKDMWVRGLLSGKYQQYYGGLNNAECNRFCVIGVLLKEVAKSKHKSYDYIKENRGNYIQLGTLGNVVERNDCKRQDFKTIAKYIQEEL